MDLDPKLREELSIEGSSSSRGFLGVGENWRDLQKHT